MENPAPSQSSSNNKSFNWKRILIGVLIGVVLIAFAELVFQLLFLRPPSLSINSPQITTPSTQEDEKADWKTYYDEDFNISFKYPKGWIKENDPNRGSITDCFRGYSDFGRTFAVMVEKTTKSGFGLCSITYNESKTEVLARSDLTPREINSQSTITVDNESALKVVYTYKGKIHFAILIDSVFDLITYDSDGIIETAVPTEGTLHLVAVCDEVLISCDDFSNKVDQILSTFKFHDRDIIF